MACNEEAHHYCRQAQIHAILQLLRHNLRQPCFTSGILGLLLVQFWKSLYEFFWHWHCLVLVKGLGVHDEGVLLRGSSPKFKNDTHAEDQRCIWYMNISHKRVEEDEINGKSNAVKQRVKKKEHQSVSCHRVINDICKVAWASQLWSFLQVIGDLHPRWPWIG